jgi:hypothetical protein
LQETISELRLDKWKRGTVREDAEANISEILQDLHVTLPPQLKTADETPEAISKVLPVSRNIDALYDVFLRVVMAAQISAPSEQITQLQQTLIKLGNARRALNNHLQEAATAQEKQLGDLRSTLQTQAATRCPVPSTPVTSQKTKKKAKSPAKASQKPATAATGTTNPQK